MVNLLAFWAKLGNETWPVQYHPVLCHLIDVGLVARHMWDLAIRHRTRQRIADRLGLPIQNAGAWLAFWIATHDIGKVSPCFQHRDERTEALQQMLANNGFNFPMGNKPHGDISTTVLAAELEFANGIWPVVSKKVAQNVAVAVGGHHGARKRAGNGVSSPGEAVGRLRGRGRSGRSAQFLLGEWPSRV